MEFVSRAGQKLQHALATFAVEVTNKVCADLGSSTGGFVDCLLQHGATKVYSIDTGYGVLAWKLRKDARVVVLERTNAMHVELPEKVDAISIDVSWTRQRRILPQARKLIGDGGWVITLVKPHYEADATLLKDGVLPDDRIDAVVDEVRQQSHEAGFDWVQSIRSPIRGSGGNAEVLALLRPI